MNPLLAGEIQKIHKAMESRKYTPRVRTSLETAFENAEEKQNNIV